MVPLGQPLIPTAMQQPSSIFKNVFERGIPFRKPAEAEFERCSFTECDFSYVNLSGAVHRMRFPVMPFRGSRPETSPSASAVFEECQLSGADFGQCEALILGRFPAFETGQLFVPQTQNVRNAVFEKAS
ncbi:MAG: pentapeptide repeat-containing protein [Alistipes sp.]